MSIKWEGHRTKENASSSVIHITVADNYTNQWGTAIIILIQAINFTLEQQTRSMMPGKQQQII